MNLKSCHALKQEVKQEAGQILGEVCDIERARTPKERLRKVELGLPRSLAAIGVAPHTHRDYKLAVRVFDGHSSHVPRMLRCLCGHMKEVDLVEGVRYSPQLTLEAGDSCLHHSGWEGTLGGFVEDAGSFYILSNNHVLTNISRGFAGDEILRLGPGSGVNETIGLLAHWHPLSRASVNELDVAIARFGGFVEDIVPWDYREIGRIQSTPSGDRFGVADVIKLGRTTGVTTGTVTAFDLDGVQVDYSIGANVGVLTFDNQIEIVNEIPGRPFSEHGDSGAFVMDRFTLEPYALLFAGGKDDRGVDRSLAQFMPDVLNAMGVRLVQ